MKQRRRGDAQRRDGVVLASDDGARLLLASNARDDGARDDADGPVVRDPSVISAREGGADAAAAERVEKPILLHARGGDGPSRAGADVKTAAHDGEDVDCRTEKCKPEWAAETQPAAARELETGRGKIVAE